MYHLVNIILYNSKEIFFVQNHDFNKNITNLIGFGYDQSIESDILLLDISNNENYIWTDIFEPSPATSPTTNASIQPSEPSNKSLAVLISAIIGSLIGGALLLVGGFFFYRWNKNKQKQRDVMQIPGSNQ